MIGCLANLVIRNSYLADNLTASDVNNHQNNLTLPTIGAYTLYSNISTWMGIDSCFLR